LLSHLSRLFSLTSFIHFNPFEAGDEPFDGLALDTAGSSTRSKNIISARPRIITLRSGPKNDRHPTSFNHGIMKVDFFHQLSLSRSATRCCCGDGDYLLGKMPAGQISVIAFDSEFNFAQPTPPLPLTFVCHRGARALVNLAQMENATIIIRPPAPQHLPLILVGS
jgi:hypothetical protein